MKERSLKLTRILFSADLRSLALMRIGVAGIIIIDLFFRSFDLIAFYTDQGVYPRSEILKILTGYQYASLHLANGSWEFQAILFLIAAVFAVLLLLGYHTKLATIASFFMLVSLINRNYFIVNSGDFILTLLLFWGMFIPWSARFSIDSIKDKKLQSLPNAFLSFGTVGFFIQIFCIYFFASLLKNSPEWRLNGTAVYQTLHTPLVTKFGLILVQLPLPLLRIMSYCVLAFEFFASLFLFYPRHNQIIRLFIISGFIFMHVFLGLSLKLGLFSPIIIIGLLGLLPEPFWDKSAHIIRKTDLGNSIYKYFSPIKLGSSKINTKKTKTKIFENSVLCNLLCIIFIAYILAVNISTIIPNTKFIPKQITNIGIALHIYQRWSMFSHFPEHSLTVNWLVMPGVLQNDAKIDAYNSRPISWNRPQIISDDFKNFRWAQYFGNFLMDRTKPNYPTYASYVCREWNTHHSPSRRLKYFNIYIVNQKMLADSTILQTKTEVLKPFVCAPTQ